MKVLRGCLMFIGGAVVLVMVLAIVGAMLAAGKNSAAATTSSSTSTGTSTAMLDFGARHALGNWAYTLTGWNQTSKFGELTTYSSPTVAQGQFLVLYLSIENLGKENFGLRTWDFELRDARGVVYKPVGYDFAIRREMEAWGHPLVGTGTTDQVTPGIPLRCSLVFDVNPTASGLHLHLNQPNRDIALFSGPLPTPTTK